MSDLDQPDSARSPKLPNLPDPSQFPEPPYPYKPRHWQHGTSTPTLSSADSSSASTRSSAYTSYARSGDFGHIHVAIGGEDANPNMGISTEDVAQLLAREKSLPSVPVQGRAPIPEEHRWSYTQSTRSRSSSLVNTRADSVQDYGSPALRGTPSFDNNWEPVEEKDEIGLTSEDETDDDAFLAEEDLDEDREEQATSAMMVAEEGRGIIVRGTNIPIAQLQVTSGMCSTMRLSLHCACNSQVTCRRPLLITGTTHLLIGSSATPNAVPAFLSNVIPPIATTLLCLDISANFLVALPTALHACVCLEELNIASNPLRALPVFLAGLTSLRVLIADSTGISTLPPALNALDKLHSLSIRRNKMNSLPSWLCLLPSLETLLVDGNPFLGPWKALVEPLLAKVPMSPLYPPSTPIFPLPSAGASSAQSTAADTDVEDLSDAAWPERDRALGSVDDEDTIVPRAPPISRSVTAPMSLQPSGSPSPSLTRTRTAPNKAYFDKNRSAAKSYAADSSQAVPMSPASAAADRAEREVRRMKSAGELRRSPVATMSSFNSATSSPQRPALSHYTTSASSSNLLSLSAQEQPLPPKRFASLGVSSALSPGGTHSRPGVSRSVWDEISADESESSSRAPASPLPTENAPSPVLSSMGSQVSKQDRESRYSPEKRAKEESKPTKWGFFKKMSMGKMRTTEPASSRASTPQSRPQTQFQTRPAARSISSPGTSLSPTPTPQIDVRISTTGTLLHAGTISPSLSRKVSSDLLKSPPPPIPEVSVSPSPTANDSFLDIASQSPQSSSSTNLLSPTSLAPGPTPRSAKRRSFLPIDVTVPAASAFMPAVQVIQASNSSDEPEEPGRSTPSASPDFEQIQRREEEKAKEARTRALRSVMAYLRDMHDLGLTQTNVMSMYGGLTDALQGTRSRRPTVVETGRVPSESSVSSLATSSVSDVSQLRSIESRMGVRSGVTTQTNSVATTDSNGSGGTEERKWKDDKGKRQRVVKEIVECVALSFLYIYSLLICG